MRRFDMNVSDPDDEEWMAESPTGKYMQTTDHEQRIRELEAELLRVRTTGHSAAHELDNISVEMGWGHSPKPGETIARVRDLYRELVRFTEGRP